MPLYLYQVVEADGRLGEVIELTHSMKEAPLQRDPTTGKQLRRIYEAPGLGIKHTPGRTKNLLADKNLAQKGFRKYVKDGDCYHCTTGNDI